MRTPPDPTRRLRQLTVARPISETGSDRLPDEDDWPPPDEPEPTTEPSGWVPTWESAAAGPPRQPLSRYAIRRSAEPARLRPGWDPFAVEPPEQPRGVADSASDPDPDAEPAPTDEAPTRRRRHRPARWGRLKQRWVPEPLHDARLDPGPRGARLLSAVAAAAAIAAALGVWLNLPTPQQLPAAPLTIAGESAVATLPATATETGTTSAALPTPVVSVDILVSVTGQVHNPGLVTLPDGARVADALAAAGGTLDGVDLTGLNLAAKLRDGDSVVVGAAGQGVSPDAGGPDPPSSGDTGGGTTGLININTADATTLERLPGVGPVMAANIIAWRDTNGSFATVDQLQEVAGIGPARFATLAPLVTV